MEVRHDILPGHHVVRQQANQRKGDQASSARAIGLARCLPRSYQRFLDRKGHGGKSTMPRTKHASKRKSQNASIPVFGAVGVSLSLAGGASDATAAPVVNTPTLGIAPNHEVTLNEEEVADISLAT